MSKAFPAPGTSKRGHGPKATSVLLDVLDVLVDRDRASVNELCEATGRNEWSVRLRLDILIGRRLVEEAGRLPRPPMQRRGYGPMTYRLHSRVRLPEEKQDSKVTLDSWPRFK